jgi:3-dehydroquinate dehydratase/shikimate dehydrogenase
MDKLIITERLIVRPWKKEDSIPFAALNADPRVREFFPSLLTKQESDRSIEMMSEHITKHGWGFWAACWKETDQCIGMVGLQNIQFEAAFTPAVEIGWRLAFDQWSKGLAVEGALGALKFAFQNLKLNEVVAFTAAENAKSRRVMEKIHMKNNPKDDFNHPKLQIEHPLCKHVLYRINHEDWRLLNESK